MLDFDQIRLDAATAERERILAIVRVVEEEADLDTEHGVGWSQACRSIDNRITQA